MKKSILIAGAAGLLFAGAAAAADAQHRGGHHGGHGGPGQHMRGAMHLMTLRAADANGDNIITRAEFDQLQAETFDWMDRNGDGYLSADDRSPVERRLRALREAAGDDEAAPRRWRGRSERASSADTDGDGRISRAEFMAAAGERFERLDANSDGQITPDELDAAVEQAREGRGSSRMFWWRN